MLGPLNALDEERLRQDVRSSVLIRNRFGSAATFSALGALALFATACGSDAATTSSSTATTPASSTSASTAPAADAIAVGMSDSGCDPAVLTAPAGDLTFSVTNNVDSDVKQEF